MKSIALLLALALPAITVTVPELEPANGEVYKDARILAINGDTVAIVYLATAPGP